MSVIFIVGPGTWQIDGHNISTGTAPAQKGGPNKKTDVSTKPKEKQKSLRPMPSDDQLLADLRQDALAVKYRTDAPKWPVQADQAKGARFRPNLVVFAPNPPCVWSRYSSFTWRGREAALDPFRRAWVKRKRG
jgi:hypothetical protein